MVWCAISKTKIIGPYFFESGTGNGSTYRNMLIQYAFPNFARLREDYIFMQDSTSPHYAIPVQNYLNNKRPNNWIGRGGPVNWPARSPDLTPCDFFLWRHVKAKVFSTPTQFVDHLKIKIRQVIRSIPRGMLAKVWENTKFRLQYLPVVQGGHLEMFR